MDEKTINSIPFDILIEVLQYLSFEDLVSSAQFVCSNWNEIVQDSVLWKDITFKPPLGMKTEKVVTLLSKAPNLRSFEFRDGLKIEKVIDALCQYNKCINSLSFSTLEIKPAAMNKLATNFLDLEYVELPFSEFMNNLPSWAKFPKLKSVKCSHVFQSNIALRRDSPPTYTANDWCSLTSLEVLSEHIDGSFERMFKFVAKKLISLRLQAVRNPTIFLLIKTCSSLEHLKLNFLSRQLLGVEIKDILTSFRDLKTLKSFSLKSFVNPDANVICNMFDKNQFPELRELDFSHCLNFTYQTARSIASACPHLEAIYLHGCTVLDDLCLQELSQCSRLRILDVAGCRFITEKGLSYLGNCIHLQELNLSWIGVITRPMLEEIAKIKNLSVLRIDHTELNMNHLINAIKTMHRMKQLSVYRAKGVDGAELQRNLRSCHVNYLKRCLRQVIKDNSNSLTNLEIHGTTNDVLVPIKHCKYLRELHINFLMRPCFKFREIISVLQNLKNLQILSLKNFVATEGGLLSQLLSSGMPELRELRLECCLSVNRTVGMVIGEHRSKLEKLALKGCVSFDDKGLLAIVKSPLLRELDISGCLGLTEKGLMHLGHLKSLKNLNISGMADGVVSCKVISNVLCLEDLKFVQADNSEFINSVMGNKSWNPVKLVNAGREAVFMPSAS